MNGSIIKTGIIGAGVFEIWVMWIKNGQKESIVEISTLIRLFHK